MPDAFYKPYNFIFASRGIIARKVDDTASPEEYLNLDNCEQIAENAFSQRLGSAIINCQGSIGQGVYALDGSVVTVAKLAGLAGAAWRYAVTDAGTLWRRSGLGKGAFTSIASSLSGNPIWAVAASPSAQINTPYLFMADSTRMMKDNGSLAAPQQMGIFQPQFPVLAEAQDPSSVVLDDYVTPAGDYTYDGIIGGSLVSYVSTTLTSAVTATGIQEVSVAAPMQPRLFQSLTIDTGINEETVLVIRVTENGFVANFTKLHSIGVTVLNSALSITVPASTIASVSVNFGSLPAGAKPIPPAWPVSNQPLQQADYIGLFLNVSDPSQVQSIQLIFDCGDGTFQKDYFYKVIGPGSFQSLINAQTSNSTEASTAAADSILNNALGVYSASSGGVAQLATGLNSWTPLLLQLSDFAGAGQADFSDPVYNWSNVVGYRISVTMNDGSSAVIKISSLVCFGGAGPDTFAGVGYDYLFTFFNENDWTESNPSMAMTNVNSPNDTNWVFPRRQPVLLTMNHYSTPPIGPPVSNLDSQITHIRVYRRGGTLGDNYRRVDQIPCSGTVTTYVDTTSDADLSSADFISFTNDVPVTSSLPVPVNTTLNAAIVTPGYQRVFATDMSNISIHQQVDLGSPTALANNFEVVIVQEIYLNPVTPHQPIAFYAYVQNTHAVDEMVTATAEYGKPVTGMAFAYGQMWWWGDDNNPSSLYWSPRNQPQYCGSASNVDVGSPDDAITLVKGYKGNLYVSTPKTGWQGIAPGSNQSSSPTIYPTACKHGCVASFGAVATEEAMYYQAIDGIRAFAGGASSYLTQEIEFLFQNIGSSPIVEIDQAQISKSIMAYWNNLIFNSYIGQDGNRHRVILHTQYKRFRNDDLDCQSINLEVDTNTLTFGDSNGLVRIDRQDLAYDEASVSGLLAKGTIPINLQSSYQNQSLPAKQKNYNNLQLDINTAGQTVTVALLFNDGQSSLALGTVNNAQRGKVNFQINAGKGQQAYKVALQLTGNLSARISVYQASIEAIELPRTRTAFDTYDVNLGQTDSKIARDLFLQYSAGDTITVDVYYDSANTPGFTFTMPQADGIRNPLRQRLPAKSFRTIRIIATSPKDFMMWQDSCLWWKPLCAGRGWEKLEFVDN